MIPEPVLHLYDEGWSLIPVSSEKKPLISSWKPYQEARAAREQLEQWQHTLAPAVWAGVTGEVSSRIALDFDVPDGPSTMRRLDLSPHRATPSGGFHVDVEYPGWDVPTLSGKTKRSLGAVYPGLDIRGTGGYINLHGATSTGRYQFLTADRAPVPLSALPEELRQTLGLLTAPTPPQDRPLALPPRFAMRREDVAAPAPARDDPDWQDVTAALVRSALDRAEKEGRNNAGFWLACQLRDHGQPLEAAELAMTVYTERVPLVNSKGLPEPYTQFEALASLDQAWRRPARGILSGLPPIFVNNRQLRDLTAEAVTAMVAANRPPSTFFRGSAPTRIVRSESGRPSAEVLKPDSMRHLLSNVADWLEPGSTDDSPPRNVAPPVFVAKDLLVREWSELPPLTGLISAPCLRPDGSLLTEPGWDEATGLWLDPHSELAMAVIPDQPTDTELADAAHWIVDELLDEFPFADQPSRANAVALVLTISLRPAIPGLVPLALLNAPVAGSGKTLLINTATQIATGRQAALTAAPSGDDDELRKRITSLLIAGEPVAVFDNVKARLTSSVLAQALTSPWWGDRILGHSQMLSLEQRATWAATGNNIQVGGDLARRCYPINLDPQIAQPWRRVYRRPNLDSWVDQHRADLLAAVLTIGRAWFARGRPDGGAPHWGTFQQWADTLAGMLEVAGIEGFLQNLTDLYEAVDVESAAWVRLLTLWRNDFADAPVRVLQLVESIVKAGGEFEPPPVIAAAMYAPDQGIRNTRLAAKLRMIEGRRFDDAGLRIERAGTDSHTKNVLWRVAVGEAQGIATSRAATGRVAETVLASSSSPPSPPAPGAPPIPLRP